MNLNKEQYKRLVKFERHLLTASKANYITAIYRATADELTGIYNDVFKANQKPTQCGKCLLNVCKRLAPLYFSYKEAIQGDENEADGQTHTAPTEKPTEGQKTQENKTPKPKRKYNRKKKADK